MKRILIYLAFVVVFFAGYFISPKPKPIIEKQTEDNIKVLKNSIQALRRDSAQIRLKMFSDSLQFSKAVIQVNDENNRLRNNVSKVNLKTTSIPVLDSITGSLYPR